MSDNSANLSLPFLLASQTQKHVTYNNAIGTIDNLLMMTILAKNINSPPLNPIEGSRYFIGSNPTGEWLNHASKIAAFNNLGWEYYTPQKGFLAFFVGTNSFEYFDGSNWLDFPISPSAFQNLQGLGIGTNYDFNNTFSAKTNSALFSAKYIAEGGNGNFRQNINKENTAKTASILFQNNWSGRAEFGLTGNDNFTIKNSSDGNVWRDALIIDSASGNLGVGTSPNDKLSIFSEAVGGTVCLISSIVKNTTNNQSHITKLGTQVTNTESDSRTLMFCAGPKNGQGILNSGRLDFVTENGGNYIASLSSVESNGNNIWSLYSRAGALAKYSVVYDSGAVADKANPISNYAIGTANNTPLHVTTNNITRFIFNEIGNLIPNIDNSASLGEAGKKFSTIWSSNGIIQTSDLREKNIESRIDNIKAANLVDEISPVLFKWKTGSNAAHINQEFEPENQNRIQEKQTNYKIISTSGKRLHAGFIAQEIKQALDSENLDFAVWGIENLEDKNSKQWLRPDQLIPIIWAALKQTRKELADLKKGKLKRLNK